MNKTGTKDWIPASAGMTLMGTSVGATLVEDPDKGRAVAQVGANRNRQLAVYNAHLILYIFSIK